MRQTNLIKASSLYETEPWGLSSQPLFLNQAAEITTSLSARQVLERCQEIEHFLGRERGDRWAARLIDIDLLIYGNELTATPLLTLPHPYIEQRKFVLIPLVELEPDLILPGSGKSVLQLLESCKDTKEVSLYKWSKI